MAPLRIPRLARGAALLAAAAALPACNHDTSCSVEVTQASGIFRGTVAGTRSPTELQRDALRGACGQLCSAQGSTQAAGCVGRCAADAEAGKITMRASCKEASSR